MKSFRDSLRAAWQGDDAACEELFYDYKQNRHMTEKGLAFFVDDVWSIVAILFLRDHRAKRTAMCANPNCPNPYFIRKRRTQKYCEAGPCVAEALKTQKREWWRRRRGKGVK